MQLLAPCLPASTPPSCLPASTPPSCLPASPPPASVQTDKDLDHIQGRLDEVSRILQAVRDAADTEADPGSDWAGRVALSPATSPSAQLVTSCRANSCCDAMTMMEQPAVGASSSAPHSVQLAQRAIRALTLLAAAMLLLLGASCGVGLEYPHLQVRLRARYAIARQPPQQALPPAGFSLDSESNCAWTARSLLCLALPNAVSCYSVEGAGCPAAQRFAANDTHAASSASAAQAAASAARAAAVYAATALAQVQERSLIRLLDVAAAAQQQLFSANDRAGCTAGHWLGRFEPGSGGELAAMRRCDAGLLPGGGGGSGGGGLWSLLLRAASTIAGRQRPLPPT